MIICGYAGIGKSYLAHNYPNIIDLESTPFEKDFDRYYKCAKHYSNQGFLVLLSCHKEIRERVLSIPYGERITIFPCIEDKELFRKRYEQRGNNEEFIKLQMDNWEKWTSENNILLGEHLEYMESGETLYDTIIRLSKLSPNRFCTYDGCPVYDCSLMKDRCFNTLEKYVKIVTKIKHHLQFTPESTNAFIEGEEHAYRTILSFLDTLEVKKVDFERELSKYVSQGIHRFFPNEGNDYYNIDSVEWQDYVIDTAKHFFELGLKAQKGE